MIIIYCEFSKIYDFEKKISEEIRQQTVSERENESENNENKENNKNNKNNKNLQMVN